MRTTIDIETSSYRLAKAVAAQRGVSLGRVVAEAIAAQYGKAKPASDEIGTSAAGWPVISIGRTITPEDVAELLDE